MQNLKPLLLVCIALMLITACSVTSENERQSFTVEGEIKGMGNTTLRFRMPGKNYDTLGYWADSIVVTNDKFSYSGEVDQTLLLRCFVSLDETTKTAKGGGYYPTVSSMLLFFIEPGEDIRITGEITDYVKAFPSGTKANDDLAMLHKEVYPILNESVNLMVKGSFTEDETLRKQLYDSANKIGERATVVKKGFLAKNASSAVSAEYLSDMMVRSQVTDDEAIEAFNSLDKSLNKLSSYREVEMRIAGITATKEGQSFPSLVTSFTPDGKEFDLDSYKGKYVMVDFWGVWCGPCVAEMPRVKEFAEKYEGKLEILGVNSGDTPERMNNFLVKNGYEWQQVMSQDGDSPDNFVIRYNVQGFPTKFILDPEGKILKRYLGSGEEAFELLESLLN